MPQVPRIRRAEPRTPPVQAREPIAVEVTMIWHDGTKQEYDAAAVAWTQDAVEIQWTTPGATGAVTGFGPTRSAAAAGSTLDRTSDVPQSKRAGRSDFVPDSTCTCRRRTRCSLTRTTAFACISRASCCQGDTLSRTQSAS